MDNRTTQRPISQVSTAVLNEIFPIQSKQSTQISIRNRLKRWGMDSYVYAPKDDYKHRAYWREMYTVEEADHLTSKPSNRPVMLYIRCKCDAFFRFDSRSKRAQHSFLLCPFTRT